MADSKPALVTYRDNAVTLYQVDARQLPLPDGFVHCCVTSPPYWGLRDYGIDGQIGLEATPEEYVASMVEVFREVRRVLRDDGTLWLNLGDTYMGGRSGGVGNSSLTSGCNHRAARAAWEAQGGRSHRVASGLKRKDLVGIPWRVAFALQADGWWLRSDIVWHKTNPQPESVQDRPTRTHEYMFLLSKSVRYYYDADVIKEPAAGAGSVEQRNRRSVWTVSQQPYSGAHFATFPPKLIEPCILAGCPAGGTVLDPFVGSGTAMYVAKELGRKGVGCDLNVDYLELARKRLAQGVLPIFNSKDAPHV